MCASVLNLKEEEEEEEAENHGACVMYWPCCGVGSVCFTAKFGLKTIPF